MAQEFKDEKSHLWNLELWKKEYEAKFEPLPQDSDDGDNMSKGGEEVSFNPFCKVVSDH